ncbi:hypothetical protein [Nitrosomonas communis]|uniref:hypothetical protein n=1 Tax=Nitrosomonas communis TaxID=44574 RepID=UPI003D2AB92E
MIDATKEVAQLEQSGFDRSVIIKIATFTSIESRQQLIANYQNQFTELFITLSCCNQDAVDTRSIKHYPSAQVLCAIPASRFDFVHCLFSNSYEKPTSSFLPRAVAYLRRIFSEGEGLPVTSAFSSRATAVTLA